MSINKLFIAGCPRSGTTALGELIGSHGQIAMGIERYGHLERKNNFNLREELFTANRFLNVEPGDTFYDDFERYHQWDPCIKDKLSNYSQLKYIGDKRPTLYLVYDEVFDQFPDAKFIYIYRDIFEVAASWNKRARVGNNWLKENDYREAVKEWNLSLRLTLEALKKFPDKIICIKYSDIFKDGVNLSPIYDWLGITLDESTLSMFEKIMKQSEVKAKIRNNLPQEHKEYCKTHADFELERIFDDIKIL